ncbi:MAG: hypothetical protein V7K48_16560 [Nostoc sp.]|uniref:hypothetical protein n=1 Tax=Nostoc sp. TaxID=1180 RepID=UPI002FF842AD
MKKRRRIRVASVCDTLRERREGRIPLWGSKLRAASPRVGHKGIRVLESYA